MTIFDQVIDYVGDISIFRTWPEMHTLFREKAARRPHGWDLSASACKAVGGTQIQAVPAVAAVGCLQMSILLIDDILDEDPAGEWNHIGEGRAANLASGLHAAGIEILLGCEAPLETRTAMAASASWMMAQTAHGQELDTRNPDSEEGYWQVVNGKSSPYHQAAFEIGAWIGRAASETVWSAANFGRIYGEIIQIHDDFKDTMAVPASPDWILGRSTLPILFAQVVEHPECQHFAELRRSIMEGAGDDLLLQAQEILVRCGAVSYTIDQMLTRCTQVEKILAGMRLPAPEHFESLLQGVIKPAQALFEELGLQLPV